MLQEELNQEDDKFKEAIKSAEDCAKTTEVMNMSSHDGKFHIDEKCI